MQRVALRETSLLQRRGVAPAEIAQDRRLAEPDARRCELMLREEMRRARRKAAVVEEAQRSPVDQDSIALERENAMRQIPVGDVVPGILENGGLEERRREIDPALVDKEAAGRVVETVAPEPPAPPGKKRSRRLGGEREKAEVVHAGEQEIAIVGTLAVLRQRLRHMRSQDHPVRQGQGPKRTERVEDLDVRIEIEDHRRAAREEMLERPRLHGRGQLGDVVDGRHRVEVGRRIERKLIGVDDLERRLRMNGVIRIVEEHDLQAGTRIVTGQTGREHARVREIVACHDRENDGGIGQRRLGRRRGRQIAECGQLGIACGQELLRAEGQTIDFHLKDVARVTQRRGVVAELAPLDVPGHEGLHRVS
jgi:hypothetical protein